MDEKLAHFKIGQIVNTQGLKGEVKIYPLTNDINRFDDLDKFYLDKDLQKEWEVEKVRYKGKMVIMKIKAIDSIEDAERLRNKFICVGRESTRDLDEDEFFIADMIGIDVFTVDGDRVGLLREVLQYSANDVYVIEGDGKEYLIPAILKFVPEINMKERKMIIDPIKGMID
ncbi:ribosome maturation factor RimM [Metaclostridioides mangenotii]|uniref:ribosome maturation factor RimM n=1 Tax=Metaclostridioides mangenotii TaxID=1540 RepID=UPI0028EC9B15|nr:ribosome maturation factor RimM [Clostridioides mangenotii]